MNASAIECSEIRRQMARGIAQCTQSFHHIQIQSYGFAIRGAVAFCDACVCLSAWLYKPYEVCVRNRIHIVSYTSTAIRFKSCRAAAHTLIHTHGGTTNTLAAVRDGMLFVFVPSRSNAAHRCRCARWNGAQLTRLVYKIITSIAIAKWCSDRASTQPRGRSHSTDCDVCRLCFVPQKYIARARGTLTARCTASPFTM